MSTLDKDIAETTRHPWVRAGLIVVVLTILTTAALGGFREAKSTSSVPWYGAGQTVENGILRITPLRAWVARHAPGQPVLSHDPKQYLVLQLRVTNLADRDAGFSTYLQEDVVLRRPDAPKPRSIFAKSDPRMVKSDSLLSAGDHSFYVDFPPRLPVIVDLTWKLRPDERLPVVETWLVIGREQARTIMTQEKTWAQAYRVARYRVRLEDRRNEPEPAP